MNLAIRIFSTGLIFCVCFPLHAETPLMSALSVDNVCPRPKAGSVVLDPPQVKSVGTVLSTALVARNAGGGPEEPVNQYDYRFCLLEHDNPEREAPVLRVKPGDLVELKLTDKLSVQQGFPMAHAHAMNPCPAGQNLSYAGIASINLHYHGLNIPPVCGADDVLTTLIQPRNIAGRNTSGPYIPELTYRFRMPANEPPGLFWYHPHVHGVAQQHLLGGMTGVLIVEGMETFFPELSRLRERVLVLRDMDKPDPADNPDAPADEPWKNVSINSVPVIYGSSLTPTLEMGPGERQFWRVANASADTHFVLQFQFNATGKTDGWQAQNMEVLARDGVPLTDDQGKVTGKKLNLRQIVLAPGARAEFIVTAPQAGIAARFYSGDYNKYLYPKSVGCAPGFPDSPCDNTDRNPSRTLANIATTAVPISPVAAVAWPLPQPAARLQRFVQLAGQKADRSRTLFFSKDPGDDGNFFITVAGKTPKAFDMAGPPDITVQGPAIEDWTIENRDNESHVFHIHQTHFRVMEINGLPVNGNSEQMLRDTIELGACRKWVDGIDPEDNPYGLDFPPSSPLNDRRFTGKNCVQPATVKLRMDFRERNIAGTFVYHCHILEHEDHGMMAKIRLE